MKKRLLAMLLVLELAFFAIQYIWNLHLMKKRLALA